MLGKRGESDRQSHEIGGEGVDPQNVVTTLIVTVQTSPLNPAKSKWTRGAREPRNTC